MNNRQDAVGAALAYMLTLSPQELREHEPQTMAEIIALRLIKATAAEEGALAATKIILERAYGRPRQTEAGEPGEDSELVQQLKAAGVWSDKQR